MRICEEAFLEGKASFSFLGVGEEDALRWAQRDEVGKPPYIPLDSHTP